MRPSSYVYTLAAAYARLRRGAKIVGIFLPGSGRLVTMTTENRREIAALFRQQAKEI